MAVYLFPYKIKDRENFYFRDHPNLPSGNPEYAKYYGKVLYHMIEGRWIDDNGTWVFMMPKLDFFINVMKIEHKDQDNKNKNAPRKMVPADLRDVGFIFYSYLLCCQGYSGFQGDEEITCNALVGKDQRGEKLEVFEKKELEQLDFVRDPNGNFKSYMDPWEYLTKHYLVERPLGIQLGKPIYGNRMSNSILLGGRGGAKTFMNIGDIIHEFLTGGVTDWKDREQIIHNKLIFGVGSGKDTDLLAYFKKFKSVWESLPGAYSDGIKYNPSAFHRVLNQGKGNPWAVSSKTPIVHSVLDENRMELGTESTIRKGVLTTENPEALVGDRMRRIQIEEFGFVGNADDVHAANENSLVIDGERVGFASYWGTSGKIEAIQAPKKLYTNTLVSQVFGIPNYWEAEHKKIGLFIGSQYLDRRFDDGQGNQNVEACLEFLERDYQKRKESGASVKQLTNHRMYNPTKPSHMFFGGKKSLFPSTEAAERLAEIEAFDINKNVATGLFKFSKDKKSSIFVEDTENKLEPIRDLRLDSYLSKKGAVSIYEMPIANKPKPSYTNPLYILFYDPVDDKEEGPSHASMLMYKALQDHTWDYNYGMDFTDNFVATYFGRDEFDYEKNHELAVQLALFYGAKILYESNKKGFYTYCRNNRMLHLLQPTPWLGMGQEPKNKLGPDGFGVPMSEPVKRLAIRHSISWLNNKRGYDNDIKQIRTVHKLYDERLLHEIESYDGEANMDSVSALLLHGVWWNNQIQQPVSDQTNSKTDETAKKFMEVLKGRRKKAAKDLYYNF